MNSRRPNSFLLRTFFDAKADEIEQIFSDGPNVNIASLKKHFKELRPCIVLNGVTLSFRITLLYLTN